MRDGILEYRVVDGDTIEARIDLRYESQRVIHARFGGIDAPKSTTPEGEDSKTYLTTLLESTKPGELSFEPFLDHEGRFVKDKYGRFVGVVWPTLSGIVSINQAMLDAGKAQKWDWNNRLGLPPHLAPETIAA